MLECSYVPDRPPLLSVHCSKVALVLPAQMNVVSPGSAAGLADEVPPAARLFPVLAAILAAELPLHAARAITAASTIATVAAQVTRLGFTGAPEVVAVRARRRDQGTDGIVGFPDHDGSAA
jgi:hypothetical protein